MDFLFLKNFVDLKYSKNSNIDHEEISKEFDLTLSKLSKKEFCDLLIFTGFIPDLYSPDSSEETLYSKLVEVIVAHWGKRLGLKSEYIKTKGSYEDIKIQIEDKIIVCDAKSFRLSRSQKAPNVKDFIKLEDYRKWLSRYKNKLGGLVTYPCVHEWQSASDAYQYCSDKTMPTLMLPYKYLSYLLHYSDKYEVNSIMSLWEYERIFPTLLKKKDNGGNKKKYWEKIKRELIMVTNTTDEEFTKYEEYSENLIRECILVNLNDISSQKNEKKKGIIEKINKIKDIEEIKDEYTNYKIQSETKLFDTMINNIKKYRIKREE